MEVERNGHRPVKEIQATGEEKWIIFRIFCLPLIKCNFVPQPEPEKSVVTSMSRHLFQQL